MDLTKHMSAKEKYVMQNLGKKDWLIFSRDHDTNKLLMKPDVNLIQQSMDLAGHQIDLFDALLQSSKVTIHDWISIFLLSKYFAQGHREYRPTMLQWIAAEHIDLDVSPEFYHQPYKLMLIYPPQQIIDEFKNQPGRIQYVMIYRHDDFIAVEIVFKDTDHNTTHIINMNTEKNIENSLKVIDNQFLNCWKENERDEVVGLLHQCLGLNMILSNFKTSTSISNAHKQKWARRKLKNKPNDLEAKWIQDNPEMSVNLVQEINFITNKQQYGRGDGESIGSRQTPIPHWRKGHWRMQPHGKNMERRKLKLINPVFVNSHLFVGEDPNAIIVKYRGKDRSAIV